MKRVLIVDDSVLMRKLLKDAISSLPDCEAVTAGSGFLALEKAGQLRPDLVILDLNMPGMSGSEVLARLSADHPGIPVIIYSATSEGAAREAFAALSLGASDCLQKPTTLDGGNGLDSIRSELLPRVQSLLGRNREERRKRREAVAAAPKPVSAGREYTSRVDAIVIASSTGGPNALEEVLSVLPADIPAPVLIVQHMPPGFIPHLAERLTLKSRLKVVVGFDGAVLEPGRVYLAPGGRHMAVARENDKQVVKTNSDPMENSCRPAANVLFRSAAANYGMRTLGLVLTGMGQDGLGGCDAIKAVGGCVLVQDEETSVVWGMPGSVAQAGKADEILPLGALGKRTVEILRQGRPWF
jgi:two-component system chemotaxis response regulator CheB